MLITHLDTVHVEAYEFADKKLWLLFTCDEETGGRGATAFCQAHKKSKLPAPSAAISD